MERVPTKQKEKNIMFDYTEASIKINWIWNGQIIIVTNKPLCQHQNQLYWAKKLREKQKTKNQNKYKTETNW